MEQDQSQGSDGNQYMSRRERRELARSQKGSSLSSGMSSGFLRRMLIWGGAFAVIAALGWGMVQLSKNAPLATTDGSLSVPVGDNENEQGPKDAMVTVVEYSDFQCPACAAFAGVVKRALAEPELKDKIRFVYRYFPLPMHPNAQIASQATQAAALQGKFWEMHDIIFEKQDAWSGLSNTGAKNAFAEYAVQLGLDKNRFLSDIDSAAVKNRVKTDLDSGNSSGVNSTPTFFVNGKLMTHPQSYEEFKQNLLAPLSAPTNTPNATP